MGPFDKRMESDPLAALIGGGDMGRRIGDIDWSATSLGPPGQWPQSLRSALSICLNSNFPIAIYWGSDLVLLYNDQWSPILGEKHPWALGRPARQVWPEIWHIIEPLFEQVMAGGEATRSRDQLLPMHRHGFTEECYFDYTFSPIRGEGGKVEGVFNAVLETTTRVVGERRLRTLRELGAWTTVDASSAEEACQRAARIIAENPNDVAFAFLYLLDHEAQVATLAGSTVNTTALRSQIGSDLTTVDLRAPGAAWPFRHVADSSKPVEVDDLPARIGELPGGAWPEPPQRAVVLPVASPGQTDVAGFLVAGVSPRLTLDDDYRGFFDLLAGHVASAVASARAYAEERRRAEAHLQMGRLRHEASEAVRQSDERFRSFMHHSPTTAFIKDAQGRYVYVNRLLEEMFRRPAAQWIGKSDHDLFPPQVAEQYRRNDRSVLESRTTAQFVESLADGDGLRYFLSLKFPLQDAQGKWLLGGMSLDVTEQRRAVEAQQQLAAIVESSHDAIVGIDVDGRITSWNRGAARLYGYQVPEIIGKPVSVLIPSDHTDDFPVIMQRLRRGEPVEHFETVRVAKDGRRVDVSLSVSPVLSADGNVVGASKIARDITAQRRAEEDLRQRERLLQSVLDNSPAIIYIKDSDGRLLLVNRQFSNLAGVPADHVYGHRDEEIFSGPFLTNILANDRRVFAEDRLLEFEEVLQLPDGPHTYLSIKVPAEGVGFPGKVLIGISTDITQRKAAEQRLQESEERFRTLFESMDEGYCVVDMEFDAADQPVDYRIVEMNPAFERHTGMQVALGKSIRQSVPGLEGFWYEMYGRVAKTGEPIRFVHQAQPMDGRWFDVYAFRLGGDGSKKVAILFSDITARRRFEQALQESEAHFRNMADNAPTMLWVTDSSGSCTYISKQWCEYTGTTVDQNLGLGWTESIHAHDREQAGNAFMKAYDRREAFRIDYRVRRRDGQYRWVGDAGLPRHDEDGRFQGYVGSVTDIHERKALEEQLRRIAAELSDANRKKDEFLATLAHELRNPLAPLRNGLQVLRLAGTDDATAQQARAMMERQLGQMVHLIDDLMDLSRISRGKVELRRQRIELAKLLQTAVETSRPAIEEAGHELTIDVPDDTADVDADLTRMAQVISNLLNNAAKYTPRGGQIHLAVQPAGDQVVISVRDNGIGIPAAMLPHVFEMFTQVDRNLDRSQGGLGIGLSIVKRLVEMHDGSVAVRSDGEGLGSEFIVRLPVLPTVNQPQPRGEQAESAIHSSRRILVVDDNRDAAMSLAMMLKLMGNETQTAYDGLEALDLAASYRPDLILLDIGMPRLNGYETAKQIRQQPWAKGIRLVALTGWGQDEDRRKSQDAGFDAHMVKPIELAALHHLLASLPTTT